VAEVTEGDQTWIELLRREPEIVAWLEPGEDEEEDEPTKAA
jgi:hypothetical protein